MCLVDNSIKTYLVPMATITQNKATVNEGRVTFKTDPELYKRIQIEAIRRNVSAASLLTEAMKQYLAKKGGVA